MRLHHPRITPLSDAALTPEQREALLRAVVPGRQPLNIFRTFAHAPDALTPFLTWGSYILSKKNSLNARQREIVILRIGYLCRSGYEWTQHVEIGLRAGISEAEIEAIKTGAEAPNWSPADAALIRASDDLHASQFISDKVWAELKLHFTDRQCMDCILTAGQYTLVSMLLNSPGVQLDEGQKLDPDLNARS